MKLTLYCVCDEEYCYCTNPVEVEVDDPGQRPPDVACTECAAGEHVWTPNGRRARTQ